MKKNKIGSKTKELWKDPVYRQQMSDAHKGHKKPKNAFSFSKGDENEAKRPAVRKKISKSRLGDKNPNWKGGISKRGKYVFLRIKPYTVISQHRYVIEQLLGRKLKKGEMIHHIDGDGQNNKKDNLLLCQNRSKHRKIHMQMEELVYELVRLGLVIFNRKTEKYEYKTKD